jgi:predicted DCC family thiol-disulfide oxidoreductase YuxK
MLVDRSIIERASAMTASAPPILVYDGECPFCANYVALLRLQESFPGLQLVDARAGREHPAVRLIVARGFRIDDGMALFIGDDIHHGADSIREMAVRISRRGPFARFNHALFRSKACSRAIYPALRAGRNLVLKLLGRDRLGF